MNKRNCFLSLVLGFALTGYAYSEEAKTEKPETASFERAENGIRIKGAALGEWTQDYDAALALAKAEKKPILLNFTGSDWCYWCKLMDKDVFSKPEWKDWAAKRLVCIWVDFPSNKALVPDPFRQRNDRLSQRYGVKGYPTYILIHADDEEAFWQGGAKRNPTPEWFREEISKALLGVLSKEEVEQALGPAGAKVFFEKQTQIEEIQKQLKALEESFSQWAKPHREKFQTLLQELKTAEASDRKEDVKELQKQLDSTARNLNKLVSEKGAEIEKQAKPLMEEIEKRSEELLKLSKKLFQD
ncbi:MAG: thioredoxin family protein [Kiritimatiellia bacterium]